MLKLESMLVSFLVLCSACSSTESTEAPPNVEEAPAIADGLVPTAWTTLFDGGSLEGWGVTEFGGEGDVKLGGDGLRMEMGSMLTGIHWLDANRIPTSNYELEVTAARLSGSDFFCGLTFPVRDSFATLVLGGWGGALTGLSCIDGQDASDNETCSYRSYAVGQGYTAKVRVTEHRLTAWVDGEELFSLDTAGRSLSLRPEVALSAPLGVACYATSARVSQIRLRRLRPRNLPALEPPIRVLLLGDSISMGYTSTVAETLGERAFVMRAMKPDGEKNENCQGTNHGVQHLDRWLAQAGGDWDVIHFNFGLHDLKRVLPDTGKNSNDPNDPYQADPTRYERQLRDIVARLEKTGARLVFATTTPVPEGVRPYRATTDPELYNAVALRVMKEHGIEINDLFGFATEHIESIGKPKDVHFTKEGSVVLGKEVSRRILAAAGIRGGLQ